jgi:hypothetical protein
VTIPMFEDLEPPNRHIAEPTGRRNTPSQPDPNRITWSTYRPKIRVACDEGLQDLVAAGGGPVARAARYRRTQHGQDLLLCTTHAQLRRDTDGLPALDDTASRLR